MEIIRPFDGRNITTVLFDFDGTLSRERDGWVNVMVATNSAALAQAAPEMSPEEAVDWVIRDIERSIGIPTYMQMKQLAAEIERRGGRAFPPGRYKKVYISAVEAMVNSRHAKFANNEIDAERLRMPGALELLKALAEKVGEESLYLASGTDIEPIKHSVNLLGFAEFFGDRVIASGSLSSLEQCAKKSVVQRLLNDHHIQPGQLLCFGDGAPEIQYTSDAGGICVGVLSPDQSDYERKGHFTVAQKRERLINAGAHVLVSDYRNAAQLLAVLFGRQTV
ncbi:MAG: HAD family hydrolase [Candidatus Zhuqueibacterota bacterium]